MDVFPVSPHIAQNPSPVPSLPILIPNPDCELDPTNFHKSNFDLITRSKHVLNLYCATELKKKKFPESQRNPKFKDSPTPSPQIVKGKKVVSPYSKLLVHRQYFEVQRNL